jgi:hypothetical protein
MLMLVPGQCSWSSPPSSLEFSTHLSEEWDVDAGTRPVLVELSSFFLGISGWKWIDYQLHRWLVTPKDLMRLDPRSMWT